METVRGTVKRVVFENKETGYKVLKTKISDGPLLTITGDFGPEIIAGTVADFHGDYKTHPKYGFGLKSTSYTISHNAEELASIKIFIDTVAPNIGPERAGWIVDHFGKDVINILDNNPEKLQEVCGIGKISAESVHQAWVANRKTWDDERQVYSLRAFLNSLGIKERRVKKILNFFGGGFRAEEILRENPYVLTEIEGFGFTTADFAARQLGILENSILRLRAYIYYTLNVECPTYGHLYLTIEEITDLINKYSSDNNTSFIDKKKIETFDIETLITDLCEKKLIVRDLDTLYSKNSYLSETQSALKLGAILRKQSDLILVNKDLIDQHIQNFERENQLFLSQGQKDALYFFAEEKAYVITGGPGTGKCLGYNTPVLMYDGTIKKVQDIKIGDLLMGDDSTPRTVLCLGRGQESLYKVIPAKGDSYIVNESHILSLKEVGLNKTDIIIDISVKEYLTLSKKKQEYLKGYKVPVYFKNKKLPLDPYLLGFWLGNGSTGTIRISTPFLDVITHIESKVIKKGLSIKRVNKYAYDISCNSNHYQTLQDKRHSNFFLDTLKEIGVFNNKHIPLLYKSNSVKNRLDLLAGLLDSRGLLNSSNNFDVVFKSKILAEDTIYIARSLGFNAYIKPCKKRGSFPNQENKYEGEATYYRFCISGKGLENIPVIVPKKKPKIRKQVKNTLVTGIKLEPIGVGNFYGFEIDGNGRFLLGDFTVTHNTTILKAIVELVKKLQLNLTCMTPTGISAKKMAETIGSEAYTIHRRLGFKGKEWSYGEDNKYDTDIVILDEASMVDQETCYRLLAALKDRVHIIFVGDEDQLPSVGAGNVLKEIINCGHIPVVRLNQIFRQSEASDIIKVAHKIKNGDTNLDLFKSDPQADVFFYRELDITKIEAFIIKLAQKFKQEKRKFQVITPRNQGPLSVESLNNILQAVLNPPGIEKECPLGNFIIRRGDRVIIIKNDYELGVYNGEIGKIVQIGSGVVSIQIDDRVVEINIDEALNKIKLAYTISCHKSQGQEYPFIILPFINQYGRNILQRNLLYTAITRAKTKVIVLGHGSALEKAINNASVGKRNTKLGARILTCLQKKKNNFSLTQPKEQENSLIVMNRMEQSLSKEKEFSLMDIIEES